MKNSKVILIPAVCLLSIGTLVTITALSQNTDFIFKAGANDSPAGSYSYELDHDNAPAALTSTPGAFASVNVVTQPLGNDMHLSYSNASASATGHVILGQGGYVRNDGDCKMSGFSSVNAVFASSSNGTLSLSYGISYDDASFSTIALTSGEDISLSADSGYSYNYFEVMAAGTVDVQSLSFAYSCLASSEPSTTILEAENATLIDGGTNTKQIISPKFESSDNTSDLSADASGRNYVAQVKPQDQIIFTYNLNEQANRNVTLVLRGSSTKFGNWNNANSTGVDVNKTNLGETKLLDVMDVKINDVAMAYSENALYRGMVCAPADYRTLLHHWDQAVLGNYVFQPGNNIVNLTFKNPNNYQECWGPAIGQYDCLKVEF